MTLTQLISKLEKAKRVHGDINVEIAYGDYTGTPVSVRSFHTYNDHLTVINVEPNQLTQEEIDDIFSDCSEIITDLEESLEEFISRPSVEEDVIPAEIVSIEKAMALSIDKQYEEYLKSDAVDSNGHIRTDTPWL